jgi:hypothetical protein
MLCNAEIAQNPSIKSKIQNQYSNTVMDAMATEVLLTPHYRVNNNVKVGGNRWVSSTAISNIADEMLCYSTKVPQRYHTSSWVFASHEVPSVETGIPLNMARTML